MSHDLRAIKAGSYTIDPLKSRIDFQTRHWFGLGEVSGSFDVTSGELVVANPVERSSVQATVSSASFRSNHLRRDAQVISKLFLDAERHPDMRFASTSIEVEEGSASIHGVLSVKANETQLTLLVSDVDVDDGAITDKASVTIDRYQHGVNAMRGIASRYLELTIHMTARLAD
jgi:polyisoprenoid-binding protein YceI